MKEQAQIIKRDSKPEYAILPYEQYLALLEKAEMLQDIHDYDRVKESLKKRKDECIPAEVLFSILDGQNPIKVWREFRQLTQQQLADTIHISKPYLSQIESGKRTGTVEILSSIANALNVSLEQIMNTKADRVKK